MDNHLDCLFSALSDPTRRAVVARLTAGPAAVSDLHAPHDMALPSFMKHLGRLEAAGLVRTEKTGRVRMVHIQPGPMAEAEAWLRRHQRLWEGRLDRLSAIAETTEPKGNPDA